MPPLPGGAFYYAKIWGLCAPCPPLPPSLIRKLYFEIWIHLYALTRRENETFKLVFSLKRVRHLVESRLTRKLLYLSEPVSEEVLEAEAQPEGPFIIKIKGLKLTGKSVTQTLTYFQEKLQPFGQLGCDKACGQCITCQTPIKIKTDASIVGYFDCYNAILAASRGLHGKHSTFGVMQAILVKTEDEGIFIFFLLL